MNRASCLGDVRWPVMEGFMRLLSRSKDCLGARLDKAVCSGTVGEIEDVCAEVEDWKTVLVDQASLAGYEALQRGEHDVVGCLLEQLPAWAWTHRGMQDHGDDSPDGSLAHAASDSVSTETFLLLVEVLGKEAFAFQQMNWSTASQERVEDIVTIWGEVAHSTCFSDDARSAAMTQLFNFVALNSTSRGDWAMNSVVLKELQKDSGDAMYCENFYKEGGWTKLVTTVADHPADEPLEAWLGGMRDEDLQQVGCEGMAACFHHRPSVMEGFYQKFSPAAWRQRSADGDTLLHALCRPGYGFVIRYMIDTLGKEAVRVMSEQPGSRKPHETALHMIAGSRPVNQAVLDGTIETILLLLEVNPTLTSITDDLGDTPLHYAASLASLDGDFYHRYGDEGLARAEALCQTLVGRCSRSTIAIRNKRGATALDCLGDQARPELVNALTVAVKSAGSA